MLADEVATRLFGGVNVCAGEDGDRAGWARAVAQGQGDARTRFARRATADRVDDDHQRALGLLDGLVNLLWRPRFFDAEAR